MRHAVIMAGGSGTRLWPLSRRRRPKQLLRLFDGRSLLWHARERLRTLFAPEHIWIITSAAYVDDVATELPDVPRENLIGEPSGRDTANAIGLAAALIQRRDADATIAVFTADHLITPIDAFASAISAGLAAAEANPASLVTFGIRPAEPHTGYGYVHRGEPISAGVHRVRQFKEKPTLDVAKEYVASGEYYWNSGMFAWRGAAIDAELRRQLPENHAALASIAAQWGGGALAPSVAEAFNGLKKISIDFGVMEHASSVLVVEMNCRWLDLGSWTSIAATRAPDASGNASLAASSMMLSARDNIVVSESDHLLVVLGLNDVVVVHSPDATLVCARSAVERIKEVTEALRREYDARYE